MPAADTALRRRAAVQGFAGLYIGQFLFLGVQLPFFPGWLDAAGFVPASIGMLIGGALVLRLVAAPVIAYRAERLADPRLALRFAAAGLFLLSAGLLLPFPRPVIALLAVGLLFCFGLIVPLTDTAVLRADRRGELRYGPIRGIGSAAFIAASLLGGLLIGQGGDGAAVLCMTGAAGLTFLATLALPREPSLREREAGEPPSVAAAVRMVRSRNFLLLLFAAGLTQGSHATYYAFAELHWSALGYPPVLIGVLWTIGVLCEIGVLLYARRFLTALGPAGLVALGAAAAALRWPLTGLSPHLSVLVLLQMLHALTFAATYLGTIEFVGQAVPAGLRTTAMTVTSTLGVGALTGIASVVAGRLFAPESPEIAYGLMGAMGALGLVLALILMRRWNGETLRTLPPSDG